MKMIRDYKDTYKKLGSDEFMMFYLGEYNMLRHEVYNKWKVPGGMLLLLVIDFFIDFHALYMMNPVFIGLLFLVGAGCTFLIMYDKWYGAVIYAALMVIFLVGDIGYIYDKALWVVGAIASLRAIIELKEIENLKVYYEMAKLTEREKELSEMDA